MFFLPSFHNKWKTELSGKKLSIFLWTFFFLKRFSRNFFFLLPKWQFFPVDNFLFEFQRKGERIIPNFCFYTMALFNLQWFLIDLFSAFFYAILFSFDTWDLSIIVMLWFMTVVLSFVQFLSSVLDVRFSLCWGSHWFGGLRIWFGSVSGTLCFCLCLSVWFSLFPSLSIFFYLSLSLFLLWNRRRSLFLCHTVFIFNFYTTNINFDLNSLQKFLFQVKYSNARWRNNSEFVKINHFKCAK